MTDAPHAAPLAYQPSFEQPKDDEQEAISGLNETLLKITTTMTEHTGHAMRAVHAKGQGLMRGKLSVVAGLPTHLAQGLFSAAGGYDVIVRLSSPPSEQLPDDVSTPRGLALKVLGVEGARVEGSEGDTTQDFLMVNGPAFGAPGPQGFLKNLKLLASTTDKAPKAKEVLSAVLRGTEKVLEAFGGESTLLKSMGGHPETNPLGETYFTQAPVLYGPYMAKFSLVPVSPSLTALKDQPLDMDGKPDAQRDAARDFFASTGAGDATWELRVQLCTDLEKMPIEDASVPWPEDLSPFITVARLDVGPQDAWNPTRSPKEEDDLAFNPWHALAAHRPIGSVMRARKVVYKTSVDFRGQHNGCPMHEPRATSPAGTSVAIASPLTESQSLI